ncbi:MAG: signal peptidase I [Candidatus Pacebacteria bacterium]|nr:signal peptidase I [Candidatus Paceibacterota bacterium]
MPPVEIKENQDNISKRKLILMFLAIIAIAFFIHFAFLKQDSGNVIIDKSCFEKKTRTVDGTSMSPFIKNGETVTTYENYYDCNEIKKGDIIIFNFKTREGDYIKKVMAMEGDTLEFEDGFIKINGEFAVNSLGEKHRINQPQQKMLSIPLEDNVISKNSYLVLGDNTDPSTFDSRKFSFISNQQIVGRVIINK